MTSFSVHSRLHFPIWRRIHGLPRTLIERWQLFELRRVLDTAYAHVPFYRELLRREKVSPDSISSLADLRQLPILSKDVFRSHPTEATIRNDLIEKRDYVWNQTSGTTGMPFRYALNSFYIRYSIPHYRMYSEFCKYRFLRWGGAPLSFIAHRMRVVELGVRYPRPNLRYFPPEVVNHDPERVCWEIAHFQPFLLEGVPTFVNEVVRVYARNQHRFRIRIPVINTHGERLTEGNREFLRALFGADVFSRYGTGETGVIGVECAARDGFHILEESFVVEIVDQGGAPVPDGSPGRVLVSFFYNDVMPFIRYDTGDRGVILPDSCRCGIPARRIRIDGREGEVVLVNGKSVGVVQFEMILSYFSEYVHRFQVRKTHTGALKLNVVPTERFSREIAERIREEFRRITGVIPLIAAVDGIPATSRGKTKTFIDEADRHVNVLVHDAPSKRISTSIP